MTKLIGYEGQAGDAPVTWGAAALDDEAGTLVNSVTGRKSSIKQWLELIDAGLVTALEHPVNVEASSPFVVLDVNPDAKAAPLILLKQKQIAGVVAHAASFGRQIVAFDSRESFDSYRRLMATEIARAVLYETVSQLEIAAAIEAGLILIPRDPVLNALRIYTLPAEKRQRAIAVTKHYIWNTSEHEAFTNLLEALTSERTEYSVAYDGGIAAGGGLDVDWAAWLLRAANNVHKSFAGAIRVLHPYLAAVPAPRLNHVTAGSAEFFFRAVVDGQSLGDRVARFYELKLLERALSGEGLPEVVNPSAVQKSLDKIRAPDADTVVKHTRLSGGEEALTPAIAEGTGEALEDFIDVVSYQSGVLDHGDGVQFTVFPGLAKLLSTRDNGDGEEPFGVAAAQEGNLYAWSICAMMIRSRGKQPYFLKNITRVQSITRSTVVTCIPSSVIRGAFVTGLHLAVEVDTERHLLGMPELEVGFPARQSAEACRDLMLHYAGRCHAYELALSERRIQHRYYLPPDVAVTDRHRLLFALWELKGSASRSDVTRRYEQLFKKMLSRQALSRVLGQSTDIRYNGGAMTLTDEGIRTARCCAIALRQSLAGYNSRANLDEAE